MIRYNWKRRSLVQAEVIIQILAWIVALGTSIGAWITTSFNPVVGVCFPATSPVTCRDENLELECVRGENSFVFSGLISLVVVLVCFVSACAMIVLYCTVRKCEDRNARYIFGQGSSGNNSGRCSSNDEVQQVTQEQTTRAFVSRERSRAVGIQGLCFASTYFLVKAPIAIAVLIFAFKVHGNSIVAGIASIIGSLSGVAYLVVFMRQRPTMRTEYGRAIRRGRAIICNVNRESTPIEPRPTESKTAETAKGAGTLSGGATVSQSMSDNFLNSQKRPKIVSVAA